mgnify:CR=1 FL=1
MLRLAGFEIGKIWGRRSFLVGICVLLTVNGFLLWYTNLTDGEHPPLSAYRAFCQEISGMTEAEKGAYVSDFKETMDGLRFVEEVLMLQGMSRDMGEALQAQMLAESPGVFETYIDLYQSESYLKFTDSFRQERMLAEELYEEWKSCADYGEYLLSVQENKNMLKSIKLFGGAKESSFSARNVEKSAGDYGKLTGEGLRWMPQKAVTGSMENLWTDLLLLLSAAFFIGYLILEDKEKQLFYITRSTPRGIGPDIWARLAALLVHCMAMAALFYGENLLFYGQGAGFGDLSASLQSLEAYRESCLQISIRQYLILSVLTKGLALFGFGTVLAAVSMASARYFLPFLAGGIWYGGSYLLYMGIPAASRGTALKYLNLAGCLRTEKLYGAYLNLNVLGQPLSRMWLTLGLLALTIVTGVSCCLILFVKGEGFTLRGRRYIRVLPFRPAGNLLLHEGYKILVMNRAALVLLAFGILIGGRDLSRKYSLSVQEQYYQDIMLKLEGELTGEKESLVLAEEAKYIHAFEEIRRIDELILAGEIEERVGEDMKSRWYAVTAFYPAFLRVWEQYEGICERGGNFVYDTGYLYLFGARGEGVRIDFLLLSFGIILAFGGAMAMEDGKGAWNLLGATLRGKPGILRDKTLVCALAAGLLSLIPYVCRVVSISAAFPLRGLRFSAAAIPYCCGIPGWITVGGMAAALALSQILVCVGTTLFVLLLSYWRKDALQAYLLGAVVLAVPMVLGMWGLSFAERLSLYPLYAWTAGL